jgi:hypothetical protein
MLEGVKQRTLTPACGHTRMSSFTVVDGIRIINAESVGLPSFAGPFWATQFHCSLEFCGICIHSYDATCPI